MYSESNDSISWWKYLDMKDILNKLDDYNRNNLETKISSTKRSKNIPESASIYYLYFN